MSRKYKTAIAVIDSVLVAHFPLCFSPKDSPKRPLKIGISADILAYFPELNPKHLSAALSRYTSHPSYQLMIKLDAPRFDLQGKESTRITEKQVAHAETRLEKLNQKSSYDWKKRKIPADVLSCEAQ